MTDWPETHVAGAVGPFGFDVIAGGHSNLTYRVTGADGTRFVLRRPPLGHRLASAHDMGREHRIIRGLQASAVPVAPALGYCDDEAVNDAPFYVMGFVDGHVVRDRVTAEAVLEPAARRRASESIVDTMAAIHAVDLRAVGLDDLGKHEEYIARQLKRWYGQWNSQKTRELPAVDQVHDELLRRIPAQGPATIVHGDYRLDNCMVSDDGTVVAVLDWEICTLGDPLADVGLLQVYWTGPNDAASAWTGSATTAPGFFDRCSWPSATPR
ncbi:MAG: phosphotransferase family protein [Ilumatobacteraceae bacterium]